MRWKIMVIALLVLLAGCSSVSTEGQTPSETPQNHSEADFELTYEKNSVTKCGPMCREANISAQMINVREEVAENVSISIDLSVQMLHIKELNYSHDYEIWGGSEKIGRLEAGESTTATREFKIDSADGPMIKALGSCEVNYRIEINHADGRQIQEGTQKVCETS